MTGILLLNASHAPLKVVSLKRGVSLVLAGRAEVIEEADDEYLRSERFSMALPKVIKLKVYVKVPYRSSIPLTRKNLTARDKGKCGYCAESGDSIDHIVPRSRGGKHEWTNVVLCCRRCNARKADKTLQELGWELLVTPHAPKGMSWYVVGIIDEAWQPYLAMA
jgi:5-methylcytosine-specific restriction endonuclease McrA